MPEASLRMLMIAALVAVHLGLALVAGSLASQAWLAGRASAFARRVVGQATQARRAGFAFALAGLVATAWLEAATMGGSALLAAGPALGTLLARTHYGHAVIAGLLAWLVAAGMLAARGATAARVGPVVAGLAAVAVFVVSRSVVSHAGSQGDLTIDVAVDAVHLALACLWVGIVFAGVRLALPDDAAPASDRSDAARWVALLSRTATAAIVGIGATGLFKVWRGWVAVGSIAQYVGSDYGRALLAKLALVGLAAALGGWNRFVVLPGLFAALDAPPGRRGDGSWRRRLRLILRVEAGTLLGVLVAAAVLSSAELPGAT